MGLMSVTAAVGLFKDTPGVQLHASLLEDRFKARLFTTIHLLVHLLRFRRLLRLPCHLQAYLRPLQTLQ